MKFKQIYIFKYIIIYIIFLVSSIFADNNNIYFKKETKLLKPANRCLINTLKPNFKWKGSKDNKVEYRLIIAERNGKVILDKWVGDNTFYSIEDNSILNDLKVYLWSVTAYKNEHYIKSKTYSFCIDLNVSLDLELLDIKLIDKSTKWDVGDKVNIEITVLNCGPVTCFNPSIFLCNGNINENYFFVAKERKSIYQDSVIIEQIESGEMKTIILEGTLKSGFNKFYGNVRTKSGHSDIYLSNNTKPGPVIQTIPEKIKMKGLFLIYPNYLDSKNHLQKLDNIIIADIYQNIVEVKQFFWNHTKLIDINYDTLLIKNFKTTDDFVYIDKNWGYVLTPHDVDNDLKKNKIVKSNYDFIYIFYSWTNSVASWSGYDGYTYNSIENIFSETILAAQPVNVKEHINLNVLIHELLHVFEYSYKINDDVDFYSPDARELETTFTTEYDYYTWILETWPSSDWLKLNSGSHISLSKYSNNNDILPKEIYLSQNYPNPFNNVTIINYEIPAQDIERKTSLKIYSILGECVRTLVDEFHKPGTYSIPWDGCDDMGNYVSSGIYFYKLYISNTQNSVKKLLFIK